jgi:hypothetical protein
VVDAVGKSCAFALRGPGACALSTVIDPACTRPFEYATFGEQPAERLIDGLVDDNALRGSTGVFEYLGARAGCCAGPGGCNPTTSRGPVKSKLLFPAINVNNYVTTRAW